MKSASPWLLAFCLLLPAACERRSSSSSPGTPQVPEGRLALEALLRQMGQRLLVMHDVARIKWNTQAPIYDAERERLLLEEVVAQAKAHGLDPEFTRSFFAAQMAAARLVQEDDFRQWRAEKQAPFAAVADLASLRKRIDAINRELLATLVPARPYLDSPEGQQELDRLASQSLPAVPAAARDAALRPLRRP